MTIKARHQHSAATGFGAWRGSKARFFLSKAPIAALVLVWCLSTWLQHPGSALVPASSGQAHFTTSTLHVSLCGRSDSSTVRTLVRPLGGMVISGGGTDGNSGLDEELGGMGLATALWPDELLASARTGLTVSSHLISSSQRRGMHTAGRDPPTS